MSFLADIVHDARRELPACGNVSPPAENLAPMPAGPLEAPVDTGPPAQDTAISRGAVPVSSSMPPNGLPQQASPSPPLLRKGRSSQASPSVPARPHGPAPRTSPLPPGDGETAVAARGAGPELGQTFPIPPAAALAGAPGAARVNSEAADRASVQTVDATPAPVLTPNAAPRVATPAKSAAAAHGSRPAAPAADPSPDVARSRPQSSPAGRAVAASASVDIPSLATLSARLDSPAVPRPRVPAGRRFSAANGVEQHVVPDQRSFSSAAEAMAPERPQLAFDADRQAPDAEKTLPRPPWQEARGAEIAPSVHIGRIDIVVQAPETPRPSPAPARTSSDAASRFYLRRL